MLPGAELAEDAVERHLGIVRRERSKAAARHRQLLGQLRVQAHREERSDERIERLHPRTEDHERLRVLPRHDDVVRAHPIRDIVAAEGRGRGEALRHAAFAGHHVDLGVAVVLRREGELRAVRRKPRKRAVARTARQASRGAAVLGHGVKFARVTKTICRSLVAGKRSSRVVFGKFCAKAEEPITSKSTSTRRRDEKMRIRKISELLIQRMKIPRSPARPIAQWFERLSCVRMTRTQPDFLRRSEYPTVARERRKGDSPGVIDRLRPLQRRRLVRERLWERLRVQSRTSDGERVLTGDIERRQCGWAPPYPSALASAPRAKGEAQPLAVRSFLPYCPCIVEENSRLRGGEALQLQPIPCQFGC